MRLAVAVALVGCLLCFGHKATSSTPEDEAYVPIVPGSRIYFHAIKDGNLMIGPRLAAEGAVRIYITGRDGSAVRDPGTYSVLKSGVLVPRSSAADVAAGNASKSRNLTFYVKGFKGILIPINLLYSKSKQRAIIDSEALLAMRLAESEEVPEVKPTKKTKKLIEDLRPEGVRSRPAFRPRNEEEPAGRLVPDRNCNGEITVFVLQSDGVLQRMPPDPYLPMGIQLSYTVKDNFLIRPRILENSSDFVVNYLTGKNGNLLPDAGNEVELRTEEGDLVSFVLGECGSLIPVHEEPDSDEHINYYYNGRMIYRGQQFPEVFSNSQVVVINNERHQLPGKEGPEMKTRGDANKTKKRHSVRKRSLYPDDFILGPSHCPGCLSPMGHQPIIARKPAQQVVFRRTNLPPPLSVPQQILTRSRLVLHPPLSVPPAVRRPPIVGPAFDPPFLPAPPPPPPPPPPPVLPPPVLPPPIIPPVIPEELPVIPQELPVVPQTNLPVAMAPEIPATEIVEAAVPARSLDCPDRIRVRTDLFAQDDRGIKIPLIPEITEQDDIVLFKLTCKGNLVRFPSCKEPEHGFEIHFQLLLDEFILVPITKNNRPMDITYVLQENGDLMPLEANENTFKKAPGSLIYFMLGKNNILFPVQQKVHQDGCVSYYYQDYHLLTLPSTANKPLHFSTLTRPIFAYVNGLTVITCSSKPRLNPSRGSNWKNLSPDASAEEIVSKDVFLSGPGGQLIKVTPFKTKSGSTVIYEMDSNGILYRSPKDKKKCIILKSYILLKEGILLPSNDTTGYMYMTSKNGDMFPYLYPDGKLEAPHCESIKYLLCEKGILLPMDLEIVDGHICYFFRDVIVYKERVYCKDSLTSLSHNCFKLHYKNDCDQPAKSCSKKGKGGVKPFTTGDGTVVYYEKCNSLLKRHPPDAVPAYLSYTMGSFEIQPDGSLFQIRYQDPDDDVINLMLEPNGDLMEDSRNEKKPRSKYYILDVNGNLIAVEGRKTRKSIYFYKNHVKICKVKLGTRTEDAEILLPESKKVPLGHDPLNLLSDPEPEREMGVDEDHPLHIPVPLKSVVMPNPNKLKGQCDQSKCDGVKETMALELEINDEIIEEIKNWAARCDKLLSRREVEESLTEALQGLNVAGLLKEEEEEQPRAR